MKSDNEIKKILSKYSLREGFYTDELKQYLKARKKYMKTNTGELDMLYWYDIVYTSLKCMWVQGAISENDFYYLTGVIGEK